MTRRIKLTITDTLAFYDHALADYAFDPDNSRTTVYWFALPDTAFNGNDLRPECREPLLQAIYGPGWRRRNAEATRYIVLHVRPSLPTPEEEPTRPWLAERAQCLVITEDGLCESVAAGEF